LQRFGMCWGVDKATAVLALDESDGETLGECAAVLEWNVFLCFGCHGISILG
jgi:hypothetical protein